MYALIGIRKSDLGLEVGQGELEVLDARVHLPLPSPALHQHLLESSDLLPQPTDLLLFEHRLQYTQGDVNCIDSAGMFIYNSAVPNLWVATPRGVAIDFH